MGSEQPPRSGDWCREERDFRSNVGSKQVRDYAHWHHLGKSDQSWSDCAERTAINRRINTKGLLNFGYIRRMPQLRQLPF
jgi:hypothetical protein